MLSWSAKARRTTSGCSSSGFYYRGQRRAELEREYLEVYHPIDERIPRFRQLPDSRLVRVADLYTAEELKTSPTYNEILLRAKYQNGLNVRLDGVDRSHMTWGLGDPVASDGWGSSEIAMIKKLLPHIRQFIRVRQALVRAEARDTTAATLLDNPRIGVGRSWQRMTAPVASCDTAMGCQTGMECCVHGRPPIGSASRG